MVDERVHWYCFTYQGRDLEGANGSIGSTYSGYAEKDKITIAIIKDNKAKAKMSDNCVLLNIIYLGHMTKAEMTAES